MSQRVGRIKRDSLLIVLDRLLSIGGATFGPYGPPFEIQVISLRIKTTKIYQLSLLGLRQSQSQLLRNLSGGFCHYYQQIRSLSSVLLPPDLAAISRVDQLNADLITVTDLRDATRNNGIHH